MTACWVWSGLKLDFLFDEQTASNLQSLSLSEFIWLIQFPQSLINAPLVRFDKQKHSAVCRGLDCDSGYRPVDMETWTMAACPTCQFSNTQEDAKLMQRYKVSFKGF